MRRNMRPFSMSEDRRKGVGLHYKHFGAFLRDAVVGIKGLTTPRVAHFCGICRELFKSVRIGRLPGRSALIVRKDISGIRPELAEVGNARVAPGGRVLLLLFQLARDLGEDLPIHAPFQRLPPRRHAVDVLRSSSYFRTSSSTSSGPTSSCGPTRGGETRAGISRARIDAVEQIAQGREVLPHRIASSGAAVEAQALSSARW